MKRLCESEQFDRWLDLPPELIAVVCEKEWHSSGPMARTCKTWLRLLLAPETLRRCVEHALERGYLYRWLTIALPDSILPIKIEPVKHVICRGPVFVTGGAVTQSLYKKEWLSDVDCWLNPVSLAQVPRSGIAARENICLDIIEVEEKEPHRCIERFDLSITQQGYYGHYGECWSTPLAYYSRITQIIVAVPTMQCVEYPTGFNGSKRACIFHYVNKHKRKHNAIVPYHECLECTQDPSTGHQQYQPWRRRMQKYASRFPGWSIVYCKAYENSINVYLDLISEKQSVTGCLDRLSC